MDGKKQALSPLPLNAVNSLMFFFFLALIHLYFPSPVHRRQCLPTLNCNKKTP